MNCEFNGNVMNGAVVPCENPPAWVMRLDDVANLWMAGRRFEVCQFHREYLQSPSVQAAGRKWSVVDVVA